MDEAAAGTLNRGRTLLKKMEEIAASAEAASQTALAALRIAGAKQESRAESFQTASEDREKEKVPGTASALTANALREHTRSFRTKSPPEQSEHAQATNEAARASGLPPRQEPWAHVGACELFQPASAGALKIQLDAMDGLAIGDVLELSFGTDRAEVITVAGFGSVIFAAPLCCSHPAGTPVRRLLEGNGTRWVPAPSDVRATPSSRPRSSIQDDEGFADRDSWSEGEREHQL